MKPIKLQPGDVIGILCPSYLISADNPKIARMVSRLNNLGYRVKFGKSFYSSYGYLAGEDWLRAKDLEDMFVDNSVKAILCMLGGYGATRMVNLIDYEIIRNHPKLFIGFSDITVLLNAITKMTQMPTIHGLVGIYLGSLEIDEFSLRDFESMLKNNQKNRVLKSPDAMCKTLNGGKSTGKLVGGNLSLIAALAGTDYDIDFADNIVFIEDVEEEPYRIDRYLSNLKLTNKLSAANGFVFGKFTDCQPADTRSWSYQDIIKQYIEPLGIPTIYDFSSGHSFPFINLPIGLEVKLDADEKTITIMEELYETN